MSRTRALQLHTEAVDVRALPGDDTLETAREAIPLPAKFGLAHVTVEVEYRKQRSNIYIWDKQADRRFSTLPRFIRHLKDEGYDGGHLFEVESHIDRARKQIGYVHRSRTLPAVNPKLTNQFAQTPDSVYTFLKHVWGKKISTFDPAPPNPTFDGLKVDWRCPLGETVYCNPPFKQMGKWVEKLTGEIKKGHCRSIVLLAPARLQPEWFHSYVLRYAHRMCVIRHGLTFKGYKEPYPWGIYLAEFVWPLTENTGGTTIESAVMPV
jgi:hypothetical protein